jgi:alkylated DNA nucleotide flippase Atl1
MRGCREPGVPCHRVIAAGGTLGGYGGSLHLKRELLRAEGLVVGMARVRGFAGVRWNGPQAGNTKKSTTKATLKK